MKKMEMITNLRPLLKDCRVQKSRIVQTDDSNLIYVSAESKKPLFEDDFVLRDIANFEKVCGDAEQMVEEKDRLVLQKKDATVEWIKADADTISIPEKNPLELDFKGATKFVLTDEVKDKILAAIKTGFGNIIEFSGDGKVIRCSVGGLEGRNKYTTVLTGSTEHFKVKLQTDLMENVLSSLKGFAEAQFKEGMPLVFTCDTDEHKTTILVAPYLEQ